MDPNSQNLPATVLLVDDEPRNLLALESLLDQEDYDLVKAQTSDEALLALINGEFAAIVLDVEMPEVNGIELARLIKQRRKTRHIPIIFLTAHYREDDHAMLAYDIGAVDYLTKPINPVVLRSKVNVFVDLFRKTRALEAQNTLLQREAEERSRRIEAEAANAAKDRFLAMLSHELRTPLTPIIYAVSLLDRDQAVPPHVREAIEIIQRNIWLEARLIDDLLDLARIRSGKLTLRLQKVDAHEILMEAAKFCAADIAQRNIHLDHQHNAPRANLCGDPDRLRQVFWNLLANAAKFTPEGGTISVTTNVENDFFQVEFFDTGVGIEAEKLERIFDAFEQADGASSAGLGLGLAICKALVELHGGTIQARSDGPKAGACFTVRIPLAEPTISLNIVSPSTTAPEPAELRILLVEDHRDTAEVLRRLLTRRGHEVRIGESVANALAVAVDFDFDLLISDVGLPDGRGTELLRKLQETRSIPVPAIAMSGFGMENDISRSLEAGFFAHLTKPVNFDELHETISRLMASTPLPQSRRKSGTTPG